MAYPDSKDAIDAARAAYDKLTTSQKGLINNYGKLATAEDAFATLRDKPKTEQKDFKFFEIIFSIALACVFAALAVFLVIFLIRYKKTKE